MNIDLQGGFEIMDPVQHLRELHDIVGSDVVTDEEINAWIAEGGPSHAYQKIAEKIGG